MVAIIELVLHRRDANWNSNKIYLILIKSRIKIDRTLNEPEINDYDSFCSISSFIYEGQPLCFTMYTHRSSIYHLFAYCCLKLLLNTCTKRIIARSDRIRISKENVKYLWRHLVNHCEYVSNWQTKELISLKGQYGLQKVINLLLKLKKFETSMVCNY